MLENVGVRLTVRVNENVGVTDLVNETVMVSVRVWLWKQHTRTHAYNTQHIQMTQRIVASSLLTTAKYNDAHYYYHRIVNIKCDDQS